MPAKRDFNHPSDLLYRPINALRGLSSLFNVMGNEQLNEVHSEEFGSLIDVVVDDFEQRIKWAEESYQELHDQMQQAEPANPNGLRKIRVPVGETVTEIMSRTSRVSMGREAAE